MASMNAWMDRLAVHRPGWNRAVLGGALLGLLVVVHLWGQAQRGFADGCLGVESLAASTSAFDCGAVLQSAAGTLLGVSNITWGMGFYGTVAVLSLALIPASPAVRRWLTGARTALLGGGVVYSAYLTTVQMTVVDAWCLLCLASAVIATSLAALQAVALGTSSRSNLSSMASRFQKRDLALSVYLVALAAVLVGADLTYFQGEAPPAPAQTTAAEPASAPADECSLDQRKSAVQDWRSLVNMQDIMVGAGNADVTVIEYFDPNCPHCATFHNAMKDVVAAHKDQVQFVYKPFPLRAASLPEIEALYVAAQQGKFTEMIEAQFARQGAGGISESDLRTIAGTIGMDANTLMTKIDNNTYRPFILEQRQQAIQIGVNSTPTVLVNGHFVGTRSPECMTTFIEQAQRGTLGASTG